VISPAQPDDTRRIAELQVRAWGAAYRGLLPDAVLDEHSVEGRERMWRRWHEGQPRRRTWVMERAGTLVGFAATGPSRDADADDATGEVYAIYIEPDLIGTGVGRRLFAHAVAALAAQGFTRATLWTLEGNARGRRFYEAAGWRPDGAAKSAHMKGVDVVEVRYAIALAATPGPRPS
jgi:GNAT superfamily N-acetyltransferase